MIRAKTIKNTVTVNKQRSVEELSKIVSTLKKDLRSLKKYTTSLEGDLVKVHGPTWTSPLRPQGVLRTSVLLTFFVF